MRITSKGQVTIPQAVREHAGLLPNTEVEFVIDGDLVFLVGRTGRRRRAAASCSSSTCAGIAASSR